MTEMCNEINEAFPNIVEHFVIFEFHLLHSLVCDFEATAVQFQVVVVRWWMELEIKFKSHIEQLLLRLDLDLLSVGDSSLGFIHHTMNGEMHILILLSFGI